MKINITTDSVKSIEVTITAKYATLEDFNEATRDREEILNTLKINAEAQITSLIYDVEDNNHNEK